MTIAWIAVAHKYSLAESFHNVAFETIDGCCSRLE